MSKENDNQVWRACQLLEIIIPCPSTDAISVSIGLPTKRDLSATAQLAAKISRGGT